MLNSFRIPIIQLKGIYIVSIQTALDDELVLRLKDDVSAAIAHHGGRGLIIDVSGIDIMDSYITRTIYDLARIAKLMGTDTVLCGMDPMIAMTLVEMGLEMEGVSTARDLETAFDRLMAYRGRRRRRSQNKREQNQNQNQKPQKKQK